MGLITGWLDGFDPKRDYVCDILFQLVKLKAPQEYVFSFGRTLIFIGGKISSNRTAWLDYNIAHKDIELFLDAAPGDKLHLMIPYKNYVLIHAKITWINCFKSRKIYCGHLPEYKG